MPRPEDIRATRGITAPEAPAWRTHEKYGLVPRIGSIPHPVTASHPYAGRNASSTPHPEMCPERISFRASWAYMRLQHRVYEAGGILNDNRNVVFIFTVMAVSCTGFALVTEATWIADGCAATSEDCKSCLCVLFCDVKILKKIEVAQRRQPPDRVSVASIARRNREKFKNGKDRRILCPSDGRILDLLRERI